MRALNTLMILLFTAGPIGAAAVPRTTTDQKHFGLGLEVGSYAALTGKYWLDASRAADFGLSFGFDAWTLVYADHLWHRARIFGTYTEFARETSGYYGLGGTIGFHARGRSCGRWRCESESQVTAVGVRVPVGLEWIPHAVPIGVFAELVPAIFFGSPVSIGIDIGLGGRYYF